tara:strand:- start:56 stop:1444 length:1389 start_codon:yes stop_codon:yes gene_type:complete
MADSPKQAEAAQALFSAIVDLKGSPLPNIPNYLSFKQRYKSEIKKVSRKVITPGVSLNSIEDLLNSDNEWFLSSVNIANKLLFETRKLARATHNKIKPKGIDLFYVRGDKNVFGSIDKLWKHTNEATKKANRLEGKNSLVFNNINKWSPADIYLASKDAQRLLKSLASGKKVNFKSGKMTITSIANFVDFSILNLFVKQLIDDGDLLPLSLKKSPDKKNTIIKTINYVENDVQKALKKQEIGYHGYLFSKTKDVFSSKDIYIKFTNQARILLQFRDKGSSGFSSGKAPTYSYQGIITGGTKALDGGLAGQSIGDVLGQSNSSAKRIFKLQNQKAIIDEAVSISKQMDVDIQKAIDNDICKKVFKFVNDYSNQSFKNSLDLFTQLYNNKNFSISNRAYKGSQNLVVRARAQFIFGKYLGGSMIEIFEENKKNANEMVTNMILYAGSRAKSSSPHFKASDSSSF